MQALFDSYIPGWRGDNASLRYALNIPLPEIWRANLLSKEALIKYVNRVTNAGMDIDVLTLSYARLAAYYKRPDLLFFNLDRLQKIVSEAGPLQIIYAGKAHPHDQEGKELIQQIYRVKESLGNNIKLVYLEEYDMELAKLMTAGSDLWLNTPRPPLEASGTSGMKAAINGTPSFSILDGWWIEGRIEGCIEGITGWAIGEDHGSVTHSANDARDAIALYDKLEQVILPTFYQQRDRYIDIMRHTIALNGSFFNTQRMLNQYIVKAYFQ